MVIKNLYKNYGKKKVLSDVNITFERNKVSVLIGINGSGKTTLMNAITSLISIDSGMIYVGKYPHFNPLAKSKIFYIPSEFFLPEYLTGQEYADYVFNVYKSHNEKLFNELISIFDFQNNMSKLISEYSYGMKKKIQIIISFSLKVDFIICDELLNGLDSESVLIVEEMTKIKKNVGTTFIIATHELEFVKRMADYIFLLKNNSIQLLPLETNLREVLMYEINLFEKLNKISRVI